MSRVHRYFLLSDSHRQQLKSRVGDSLRGWGKAWGAQAGSDENAEAIVIQSSRDFGDHPPGRAVKLAGETVAWLSWPQEPGVLLDRLAGGAGKRAGALSQQVEQRLMIDLLARIYATEAININIESGGSEQPEPELFGPGGDAVVVKVSLADLNLTLLMRGEAIRAFAPGPTPVKAAASLVPLGKAIEGQIATISVSIEGSGGVLLSEISDLAEGHILLLDQSLDADWQVLGPGGELIGRCRPGRKGEHFAVQLLAPNR